MRDGKRVFIDSHIVTLFKFLEEPDLFIPAHLDEADFVVTLPVVRELERIKDEHFSSGQRSRAKKCLSRLEAASRNEGTVLTDRSSIFFRYAEPSEQTLHGHRFRADEPDDRFIAAVWENTHYENRPFCVLSDDVGVRLRVKPILGENATACKPPALRYPVEDFNLPQLVKAAVKELARELASELSTSQSQRDLRSTQ